MASFEATRAGSPFLTNGNKGQRHFAIAGGLSVRFCLSGTRRVWPSMPTDALEGDFLVLKKSLVKIRKFIGTLKAFEFLTCLIVKLGGIVSLLIQTPGIELSL